MAVEGSVVEALSGLEVVEAVVSKVREALYRDCYLGATTAYEGFSADVAISIRLRDVGREVAVESGTALSGGQRTDLEETRRADLRIEDEPPNQVRVESGQPVPVLKTRGDGSREIHRVSYKRPERAGADEEQP